MASMTRRSRDIPGTYAHSKHKSERARSIAFRGAGVPAMALTTVIGTVRPASADKPPLHGSFFEIGRGTPDFLVTDYRLAMKSVLPIRTCNLEWRTSAPRAPR